MERLGEYEVVIPRRINGQGKSVDSTQNHFPKKRAKRSVLEQRYPGIYGANNPKYRSEQDHPGDPLYPAKDNNDGHYQPSESVQYPYPEGYPNLGRNPYQNSDLDLDLDPGQHPGHNPGQHPGQNYNGANSAQNSNSYNGFYYGTSVNGNSDNGIDNKINPLDSGAVKHSYEVHNSNEFDSDEQFNNYIDPRSETHQESWDRSHDRNGGYPAANENTGDIEDADSWDNTHYSLEAFGRQFDLHLEPNLDFLSEGVVIQHLDTNRTWLTDGSDVGLHCFQRGKVAGDPSSSVVLSICDNLVSSHFF